MDEASRSGAAAGASPTGRVRGRVRVRGTISSAGFGSGDRFVVGHWPVSPIGPFGDVMWATPAGERILLVGSDEAAAFVGSIYRFDRVDVAPLAVRSDGRRTTARSERLRIELVGGRARRVPGPRPLALTRHVEAPIARALMGVETYGTSPTGVPEWYQARAWRWVRDGKASIDGRDLGPPGPLHRPMRVGFSEPPRRPSIVSVQVTIDLGGRR